MNNQREINPQEGLRDGLQEELNRLLIQSAQELVPDLEEVPTKSFEKYMRKLLEYNTHTNLTAITDPIEIYQKHFVDSMTTILALEYLRKKGVEYPSKRFIDVGTGAGFPSVPVKICLPMLDLTLLDSLKKRTRFLEQLAEELGLENLTIQHARAEDAAHQKNQRESYDFVLSRAVANLPVLLEYCLPFLKKGGYMICLKGPSVEEELKSSRRALKVLGGEVEAVLDVTVASVDWSHKIAIIKKVKNTDRVYPRKAGKPSKDPIL